MITIDLRTGKTRAEGYRVRIPGWLEFDFYCHHADDRGEVAEARWVVSEETSGRRLTINDYPTDLEAIRAAHDYLAEHSASQIRRWIAKATG